VNIFGPEMAGQISGQSNATRNFENTFRTGMLEKALDAASLRQQVISNNIANVNTEGFKPSTVAFEEHLSKAMADKDDGFDMAGLGFTPDDIEFFGGEQVDPAYVKPTVHQSTGKVDPNQEMVNLAKNQIYYNAVASKLSGYLGSISYVIDNSGR